MTDGCLMADGHDLDWEITTEGEDQGDRLHEAVIP